MGRSDPGRAESGVRIRPFRPEDQAATKALILDGLVERWGFMDPAKNPDLDDIAASFAEGTFRVAVLDGRIIGTGAVVRRTGDTAEIRRMSVARPFRRRGVGRAILRQLIAHAKAAGCRKIILETTAAWKDAQAFYLHCGFRITHRRGGDTFFLLELNPAPASVV